MTLVDTNVVVDVLSADPTWLAWSIDRLAERARHGTLAINEVIYAEIGVGFASVARLDATLAEMRLVVERTPKVALFLAGKAFRRYRDGGVRTGVLPDFFIGAHAVVAKLPLLTRDPQRYRTYFPEIELIVP